MKMKNLLLILGIFSLGNYSSVISKVKLPSAIKFCKTLQEKYKTAFQECKIDVKTANKIADVYDYCTDHLPELD